MTNTEKAIVQGELTEELNAPYTVEPTSPFATPPGVDDTEFQKAMSDLEQEERYQRHWEECEDSYDRAIARGESGEEDDDLRPEEAYDRYWEECEDAYDRAIERGTE